MAPHQMECVIVEGDSVKLCKADVPAPGKGEALVRVTRAGICNTDLEIMQGYMGFKGIVGHEFLGVIQAAPEDCGFNKGDRVVGDINLACGECEICKGPDNFAARNHCPKRTVLGILNKEGTYAEYLTLPLANLHKVPDSVSDKAALFAEPLAAACRILEQGLVKSSDTVAVIGDGKLGLLIAHVIASVSPARLLLLGHHESKLELAPPGCETRVVRDGSEVADLQDQLDVVVAASGSPKGLQTAAGLCRPLGTLVLKTTCAAGAESFNTAPFVIKEINVIGSRCGPFDHALRLLAEGKIPVEKLITAELPFSQALEGIELAKKKGSLKVQLVMAEASQQKME